MTYQFMTPFRSCQGENDRRYHARSPQDAARLTFKEIVTEMKMPIIISSYFIFSTK